jgi:phosphate acyltransferase
MIRVAVDAMGSDKGAEEVVAGALEAASDEIVPVLFGSAGLDPGGLQLVQTTQVVGMDEKPADAFRTKQDSSLVRAVKAVADGDADAVVSPGNTGAMLAAGLVLIRRLPGVLRPAIAVAVPARKGPAVLIDAGANADARPEHLVQFAHMGAAFMETVMGIAEPRVALLSNGEEPTKGTPDIVAVHEQLAARREVLRFVGNVEGTQVTEGAADVVVMDGFTGNVTLKVIEGTSRTLFRAIRDRAESSPRAKLGGLLLRPALRGLRDEVDPETPGGAYMLGLRRLGVVAHGRFTRRGFARAIEVAAQGVGEDVIGRTHAALEAAGVLRQPSEAEASVTPS